MKDFLKRDPKTFVVARTANRLGWEKTLAKGEAYSTFLLPAEADPDPVRRYLKAYKAAKQVIEAIVDVPVTVKLHPTESSANAANQILISTQVLEDTRMTFPHRMDVILGEAAHEAAHILYTDFLQVNYDIRTAIGKLKHTIANIIEDERIEMALGQEHPGYSRFIEKIKDYYFNRLFTDHLPDYATMSEAEKLFLCFFRMVRYPTQLRKEELDRFSIELEEIRQVLSPYPTTDQEVHLTTEKVYAILNRYYQQEKKENYGDSQTGENSESVLGEGEEGSSEEKPGTLEEATKEMIEQISKQICSSLDQGKELEVAKSLPQEKIMKKILEGSVTLGSKKDTFFIKQKGDESQYRQEVSQVRKYVKTLANKLQLSYQNREIRTTHLRSGNFDTRRIVEAAIGIETVYEQRSTVKSKPVSVGLLIDESGSMSGRKIGQARQCAILFQEALKKVPGVSVFIYGHSADHERCLSTDMHVYQEPGHSPRYALGSVTSRGNNRDGVAIEQVSERIRQHTKDSCVLFVISDGQPCARDYDGQAAIKQTREAVEKVERDNFTVIQIAIEQEIPSEEMFKNFVKLTTLDTLVKEVGLLLTKEVLKMR